MDGDDASVLRSRGWLDWRREVIQRRRKVKFKVTFEERRPGAVMVLNKIVTLVSGGIEHEAGQRIANILMKGMG